MNIKTIGIIVLLAAASGFTWAANSRPSNDDRPQRPSFSSIDANGDGIVEIDEFSTQKLPGGDYQTIFTHIDSNSDGEISEEEFENHKPPGMNQRGPKRD